MRSQIKKLYGINVNFDEPNFHMGKTLDKIQQAAIKKGVDLREVLEHMKKLTDEWKETVDKNGHRLQNM